MKFKKKNKKKKEKKDMSLPEGDQLTSAQLIYRHEERKLFYFDAREPLSFFH